MIQDEVNKFLALAPLMLSSLIDKPNDDETEITDDAAILYFPLEEKLPIGVVIDTCLEEMELEQLFFGSQQSDSHVLHACLFPNPSSTRQMFKMNLATNHIGYVAGLTVTVYDDAEKMEQGLEDDLNVHAESFDFTHALSLGDVLSFFCKM